MYTSTQAAYIAISAHKASLEKMIDDEAPSTEGLNILYSIFDFFGRIANNLKTYIVHGFRSFSRSELEAYIDSHAMSISAFLRNRGSDFSKVKIPVPDGMIVTYPEAVAYLIEWQGAVDMATVMADTLKYFEKHKALSVDKYATLTHETQMLTKSLHQVDKKQIEQRLRKQFTTSHTHAKYAAGKVIGERKALLDVHASVLQFAMSYRTAAHIISAIDEVEASVGTIVETLKQTSTMNVAYLKAFHGLVATLAEQLDMFGALLDYEQRVEHNYVLSLRAIIAEAK